MSCRACKTSARAAENGNLYHCFRSCPEHRLAEEHWSIKIDASASCRRRAFVGIDGERKRHRRARQARKEGEKIHSAGRLSSWARMVIAAAAACSTSGLPCAVLPCSPARGAGAAARAAGGPARMTRPPVAGRASSAGVPDMPGCGRAAGARARRRARCAKRARIAHGGDDGQYTLCILTPGDTCAMASSSLGWYWYAAPKTMKVARAKISAFELQFICVLKRQIWRRPA